MRALLPILALSLAGCASPEYVASRSDFDVCRLSMGGPHAAYADAEARNRGLQCAQYYPAILQRQAQQNSLVQQMQPPRPVTCTTTSAYGIANTTCR